MKQNTTHILVLITLFVSLTAFAKDSVFSEYEVKEFVFQGRDAKVVFPKKANANGYWIWRARFWGAEPQVDKALLEKGFHVVYVDVAHLFGNEQAVQLWNDFYAYCVSEYKLNKKVVLEGLSRGGLIIYNWAAQNTDKVFTIYADAPVCDIKSWPGGLYSGEGSPKDWERCLAAHGLDSVSVKSFKGIPIHTGVKVAEAGIPVLHVYGAVDVVVPFEENTALLKEKFEAAGGTMKLIRKEGVGHHPHSLKDPAPIVDFILDSVDYKE